MTEEKKCECGMLLSEETQCSCDPSVCIHCCKCASDCQCGCQDKAEKAEK